MDSNYNEFGKFREEKRTFKTRVQFISDIFSNKHEPIDVLASSIRYKLGKSFERYMEEMEERFWTVAGEDVLKVLKKIDY